jgi:transcriptional regulator with XRE-family HTH domain
VGGSKREEVIKTSLLKQLRSIKKLTQKELAEKAGVSNETIVRLERHESVPQPATIRKLADALEISFDTLERDFIEGRKHMEAAATKGKVEVAVRWRDDEDRLRGEILRFRGKELARDEHGATEWTLYECPNGYRVFVENFDDDTAELHPRATWGQADYITYESAEELVEDFPLFGEFVGIYPVRDLD